MENNNIDTGFFKSLITDENSIPLSDVRVTISEGGNQANILEELVTDSIGETDIISLAAPPIEFSMTPSDNIPYSTYIISVNAPGYNPVLISGMEVFSGETSLQPIVLSPVSPVTTDNNIVIGANTLYGDYPPKIPESETKPIEDTGEIVLDRVVIPEYIVVHDGPPGDSLAKNYYVRYKDYIKNVASSEIYSTWPTATLRANILAIMSFTLNRVYTEWYRNQQYPFTITSSTAYDHKWIYGRNIFENISKLVDEIFNLYLSRPNVKQPILTQYCDGKKVSCPNWMSQWGSKYLGDQNYTDIEILRYYYGSDMYINSASQIAGVPSSYPGTSLRIGSSGNNVRTIQEQLNRISDNYRAIPKLSVDGIYGENTKKAVTEFQKIFNLTPDGIVGFATWYKISDMYVRLTRIAELQ